MESPRLAALLFAASLEQLFCVTDSLGGGGSVSSGGPLM